MRLGELLLKAGAITLDELEAALHAQVMWGARLGTALVELGSIDLDSLSNALAAQHHVPAALANHFDRADRALQLQLSPSIAERYECVPLSRVGKHAVVVAAVAPLDAKAVAILADELGVETTRIIFAVAPELRIRYALERVYKIARPQRFLRAPGSPNAPKKRIVLETLPLELDPVDLVDDDDLPDDAIPIHTDPTPSERRSYVPLIATAARSEIATSRTKTRIPRAEDQSEKDVALEAIKAAPDRDTVARLMVDAVMQLEPASRAAVLLIVRSDVAVSWTFSRKDGLGLAPTAVPLDQLGLVPSVIRKRKQLRAAHYDLSDVDHALTVTLGVEGGEAIVEPLVLAGKVAAVLFVASHGGVVAEVVTEVAAAAATAFERLMRNAIA